MSSTPTSCFVLKMIITINAFGPTTVAERENAAITRDQSNQQLVGSSCKDAMMLEESVKRPVRPCQDKLLVEVVSCGTAVIYPRLALTSMETS